jgi:hypothetical protein
VEGRRFEVAGRGILAFYRASYKSIFLVILGIMKTVLLELEDDIADWLLSMDNVKRSLFLKLMNELEKESDCKKVFIKTSDQAEKQGLNNEE